MNTTAFLVVGGTTSIDDVLQLPAQTIVVNNYSNQWVELPGITQFVPPYWIGATYPGYGTNRQTAKFNSPVGIPQAATIAAQSCVVLWLDIALPPNPGQPITVRAPSTEWRNPKNIAFNAAFNFAGPVAFSADWSYTVPSGRRARVDTGQLIAELSASDGSGSGTTLGSRLVYQPISGGGATDIIRAEIFTGVVLGARADVALAAGKEMQAGDILQGQSGNLRGAGVTVRTVENVVITEGDA